MISKREVGSYISSRERPWDEHVASILNHDRLAFRSNLLINGIFHQLSKQTLKADESWFRLIVATSSLLPVEFKERLYSEARKYPWLRVIEKDPEEWVGAEKLINSALIEMTGDLIQSEQLPFLSFRLDDDDFIPVDYLERCKLHIVANNINKFLTFKNGAKVLWSKESGKICNFEKLERPFIAIGLGAVCSYDPSKKVISSKVKSVFAGISHYEIESSHEVIIDDSDGMFIWSHHSSQDTHGRFKSVEFKGPWERVPFNISDDFKKYPALIQFL